MTFTTTLLKKFWCWIVIYWQRQPYLWIQSEDVYEEFFKRKHLFDFSNFSKDSELYDNQNKMIVGKGKVKHKGIPINKFVDFKSKMYSMLSDGGK